MLPLSSLIITLPVWRPYFQIACWDSFKQPHFDILMYKILGDDVFLFNAGFVFVLQDLMLMFARRVVTAWRAQRSPCLVLQAPSLRASGYPPSPAASIVPGDTTATRQVSLPKDMTRRGGRMSRASISSAGRSVGKIFTRTQSMGEQQPYVVVCTDL